MSFKMNRSMWALPLNVFLGLLGCIFFVQIGVAFFPQRCLVIISGHPLASIISKEHSGITLDDSLDRLLCRSFVFWKSKPIGWIYHFDRAPLFIPWNGKLPLYSNEPLDEHLSWRMGIWESIYKWTVLVFWPTMLVIPGIFLLVHRGRQLAKIINAEPSLPLNRPAAK